MDIIFWNDCPPYGDHPVGLIFRYIGPYKVAHWVRQHGYEAQVIDYVMEYDEEELWELTTRFVTDKTMILGISATFLLGQLMIDPGTGEKTLISKEMLNVLTRFRKEYPHIKIIAGGYMAEVVSGWNLIHARVIGFGEDTTLELLNHYRKQTPPPKSRLAIPRFGLKPVLQYYEANEKKYNIETDAHKFSLQDCILPNDTLPLEVSRGCMFKCKFCRYPLLGRGKLDYLRHMDCLKDEIVHNYETFGVTNYYVVCDTFNDTEFKMNGWYDMITKLPFKINFSAYLRADLLHRFPDMAHQLKETGLFGAYHGIESLDPEASKLVGKAWSGKHAREWIPQLYHDIWKGEVPQSLNLISGLPGETMESMHSTVDWFLENKLYHMNFYGLKLDQHPWKNNSSEFERNAQEYGFKFDENGEWYNGEWNLQKAVDAANILNERLKKQIKMGTWSVLSLLALGYDKQTLLTRPYHSYKWITDYLPRKIKYMDEYKRLLRSI